MTATDAQKKPKTVVPDNCFECPNFVPLTRKCEVLRTLTEDCFVLRQLRVIQLREQQRGER